MAKQGIVNASEMRVTAAISGTANFSNARLEGKPSADSSLRPRATNEPHPDDAADIPSRAETSATFYFSGAPAPIPSPGEIAGTASLGPASYPAKALFCPAYGGTHESLFRGLAGRASDAAAKTLAFTPDAFRINFRHS